MAHRCKISGKGRQSGHRVSHANNKTKHTFKANLQTKKLFIPELGKSIRTKLSTRMIRTIDKNGLQQTLKKHSLRLEDLLR
jgi:large subunit ribosomal protein L28